MLNKSDTMWLGMTVTANKTDCCLPRSVRRDAKSCQAQFRPKALLFSVHVFPAIHGHHAVATSKLLFCRHVLHHIKLFQSPLGEVLFSFTIAAQRAKSII